MEIPKIHEGEYRFCLIMWEHEPISAAQLVKLCQEQLGWKRTTTYTVIKRLGERGILKNEDGILPVKEKKIAVIGDMAKIPRYQGAGSSTINPYKIENAYDNFVENGIEVEYAKGYERIEFENDESLRREAVKLAEKNDIVIVFAGLTENYESEGVD